MSISCESEKTNIYLTLEKFGKHEVSLPQFLGPSFWATLLQVFVTETCHTQGLWK